MKMKRVGRRTKPCLIALDIKDCHKQTELPALRVLLVALCPGSYQSTEDLSYTLSFILSRKFSILLHTYVAH